jgi:hypothetical protein
MLVDQLDFALVQHELFLHQVLIRKKKSVEFEKFNANEESTMILIQLLSIINKCNFFYNTSIIRCYNEINKDFIYQVMSSNKSTAELDSDSRQLRERRGQSTLKIGREMKVS